MTNWPLLPPAVILVAAVSVIGRRLSRQESAGGHCIGLLGGALLGVGTALWFRAATAIFLPGYAILIPSATAWGIVVCVVARGFQSVPRARAILASVLTASAAYLAVGLPLSQHLARVDLADGQAYCDSLRPIVEEYRAHHERYPEEIDSLAPGPRPRSLVDRTIYYGDTDRYCFRVPDANLGLDYGRFGPGNDTWSHGAFVKLDPPF